MKEPSYGTILIWTKKLGLYQLEKEKEKADDWVIILDESVEFGHDKLLVIYGIPSSKINFKRALNYNDLTPLTIASGSKWTGDLIEQQIKKVENEYGKILYAVADGGNAIRKSLRKAEITHVYDLTHKLAWFLKELYKEDPEFISYTKQMAKMRGALSLSEVSHVLPPNQRVHSRFMNLDVISEWGMKILNYLNSGNKEDRIFKELKWVENFEALIQELTEVNKILAEIKALLKTQGLSVKNKKKAKKILEKLQIQNSRTNRLKVFISDYLDEIVNSLPKRKNIVCTSDIIESSFGKYKNYISNNPMVGITNLSLTMAAFTSKLESDKVNAALENVKTIDIKQWSQNNIGDTNLQRRKRVLKKVG